MGDTLPNRKQAVKKQLLGQQLLGIVTLNKIAITEQCDDPRRYAAEEKRRSAAWCVPIDDLQILVDLAAFEIGPDVVFAAKAVDQLVGKRLAAGEDATVGKLQHLVARQFATLRNQIDEPAVA